MYELGTNRNEPVPLTVIDTKDNHPIYENEQENKHAVRYCQTR